MKTGMTLTAMAAEIERQSKAKRDFVAPTSQLTMANATGGFDMQVGSQGAFTINDNAHQQIGARLEIPRKYYDRMRSNAASLLISNVNHWMGQAGEKRMIRTLDGNMRAFLSNSYRPIDNFPIAEAALDVLQGIPDMRIESCAVTDSRLYLKAVFPRIEGEVKKGDVVQAGLLIQNSEVGQGALKIMPMSYRLVCLNGMIHTEYGQRRNHVGGRASVDLEAREIFADDTLRADDKAFLLKVRDTVKAAADEATFMRIVNKMQAAAGLMITGNPAETVEVLADRYAFNEAEKGGVLRHLIEGGDLSAWGLGNAITALSQDVESYDRATELENLGGQIIELPRQEWKVLAEAA